MPQSTRDRILDAAAAVVLRAGTKGLTTKAIAAEAGLTEPALYTYFENKDALCVATASERVPCPEELADRIRGRVGEETVLDTLRDLAVDLLRYYLASVPFEMMFWADPRLREIDRGPARAQGLLPGAVDDYLRGEQQRGRIPTDAPTRAVAHGIVGALFRQAFIVSFNETTLACEEASPLLDEVVRLAAAALRLGPDGLADQGCAAAG
ncbi:MAG: hypothetical protein CVT65_10705 [Actinobacteria bacterium HGW-Actinobacteria-5]|jgi:AcrR family transcriptional regulator|nr:MAG: hypothetical protein CVT65_10705 [Actinobacteria bacterium HGW-Actinobacteria-5]